MRRLLEALTSGPVDHESFVQLFVDPATGELDTNLISAHAGERIHEFKRAREALEELGFVLKNEDGSFELDSSVPLEALKALDLSEGERAILAAIDGFMHAASAEPLVGIEPALLMKTYLLHNLRFTYGGDQITGVLVAVELKERPGRDRLVIRTKEGDESFFADAVDQLYSYGPVTSTGAPPPGNLRTRPADPIDQQRPPSRGRGRPTKIHEFVESSRIVDFLAYRLAERFDVCGVEELEGALAVKRTQVKALISIVEEFDESLEFNSEDKTIRRIGDAPDRLSLSGFSAAVARMQLHQLDLLGDGNIEALITWGISSDRDYLLECLDALRERLDSFLSGLAIDRGPVQGSCGRELVAAIGAEYSLAVRLAGEEELHTLVVHGLLFDEGRWFVVGELDGQPSIGKRLPLGDVVEVIND
jgi:hypothetical protein